MLDIFSSLDRFSGSWGCFFVFFWVSSLYLFMCVISSSSYWFSSNRASMLVLGLHKFDPGQMHKSQPYSDPSFSIMICSSWLVVGFMGFLSMFPYFNDLAREPAFIYSVTMTLWWYALTSYSLCSPMNFIYSVFLGPKTSIYFIGMLILESVSWLTRGFTFGARFLISGTFGTCVSYVICDMLSWSSSVVGGFSLLAISFFWNIYEVLAISFQCYLIGLLGICFCNPHPMGFSSSTGESGGVEGMKVVSIKKSSKKFHCLEKWNNFVSS